jgi:hypothetical protein
MVLTPKERLAHMAQMYDSYGYGLDSDMNNYGYGAGAIKKKRKLTEYNKFFKKLRLQGYSAEEIGKAWRKAKKM